MSKKKTQFAAGYEKDIQPAIDDGTLRYPAYVFVRSDEENVDDRLAFVDKDEEVKFIVDPMQDLDVIDMLIQEDVLLAVTDADGAILSVDGDIILW